MLNKFRKQPWLAMTGLALLFPTIVFIIVIFAQSKVVGIGVLAFIAMCLLAATAPENMVRH